MGFLQTNVRHPARIRRLTMKANLASDSSPPTERAQLVEDALGQLADPLTVKQLSRRLSLSLDESGSAVRTLRRRGLVRCLNPEARRSRVYRRCSLEHPERETAVAQDWGLYGWVCFSHRAAVLKALDQPRRPADIKRRARFLDPEYSNERQQCSRCHPAIRREGRCSPCSAADGSSSAIRVDRHRRPTPATVARCRRQEG